jgi:RNA polymerase sigma-70 factor (ECF subfamily)
MGEGPVTRPSLLVRLRDARDREAWGQFVEAYAPLVYAYARRRGLQDADAADVTQIVLQAVASAIRRLDYDPRRGTFRGWFFSVTRTKLSNYRAAQRRHMAAGGSTAQDVLEAQIDPQDDLAEWWNREYEQRLFHWAAARVRPQFAEASWRAFWATAVQGRAPQEVADELGQSVGAVYIAKSRVLARLRECLDQFREDSTP